MFKIYKMDLVFPVSLINVSQVQIPYVKMSSLYLYLLCVLLQRKAHSCRPVGFPLIFKLTVTK